MEQITIKLIDLISHVVMLGNYSIFKIQGNYMLRIQHSASLFKFCIIIICTKYFNFHSRLVHLAILHLH